MCTVARTKLIDFRFVVGVATGEGRQTEWNNMSCRVPGCQKATPAFLGLIFAGLQLRVLHEPLPGGSRHQTHADSAHTFW